MCGYEVNADYNAAKNVGLKHLRAAQTSSDGGARVNVRLNRGTLDVNGDFEPACGGQNGSPRESPITRTEGSGWQSEAPLLTTPSTKERRSRERVGWGSLL
jgi:hypothetical protein